jgi:hypothetical protein
VRLATPEIRQSALAAATAVAAAAKQAKTVATAKAAAASELDKYKDEPQKSAATVVSEAIAGLSDDANGELVSLTADAAIARAVPETKAKVTIGSSNPLILETSSEGGWGKSLRVRVDYDVLQAGELLFLNGKQQV